MPHKCVKCGKLYPDGSNQILKGCDCGAKFFFFMKKKDVEDVKNLTVKLTTEEKQSIMNDALELLGEDEVDKPVILDLESVRMLKPGKFEIDLVDLFKGKPLVYKLEDGKYLIDLASTFRAKDLSTEEDETD